VKVARKIKFTSYGVRIGVRKKHGGQRKLQIMIRIRPGKESTQFVSCVERGKEKKTQKRVSREDHKLPQEISWKQSNCFDYSPAAGTTRRKYLDYFIFKIVDYIAPLCASAVPHHARGLAAAHSRKLSTTLGGSTSTRPGVRKFTFKTCDFVDISNATIPTALGGSTATSPPIVIVILRQQLDYVCIDYAASSTPHPIKAKFSSSKS
jgi:hypothetical protein